MSFTQIQYAVANQIATITLNRPEKLNAYTYTMMVELIDAFDKADADDNVRAIIVTGSGRAFCAGADLGQGAKTFDYDARSDRPDRKGAGRGAAINWSDESIRDSGGRLTLRIFESLKPVIGAINGPAVGIGVTMQLPMDIRIASDSAKFGFVFTRRGITPEACSGWFLPRIVGISQAMEWCATGRIFDAQEALNGRLVSRVLKAEDLMPTAIAIAGEIAANTAPVSVALTRQMMWRMMGADHPMEAHKVDSKCIYARGQQGDAREGVMSFLEKRPAKFQDKVSKDMPPFFPWWQRREYS